VAELDGAPAGLLARALAPPVLWSHLQAITPAKAIKIKAFLTLRKYENAYKAHQGKRLSLRNGLLVHQYGLIFYRDNFSRKRRGDQLVC
jgi:hypothetical protein